MIVIIVIIFYGKCNSLVLTTDFYIPANAADTRQRQYITLLQWVFIALKQLKVQCGGFGMHKLQGGSESSNPPLENRLQNPPYVNL